MYKSPCVCKIGLFNFSQQTLKTQYPDTDYELKTLRQFKFAKSQPLKIHFERKLAGGWHLALENNGKVSLAALSKYLQKITCELLLTDYP